MSEKIESRNKALVLEAFDALFNKRDYAASERFWSPDYIQHGAHIAPGREGLFNLFKSMPPTLKYEPGTIVAEGNLVIVQGRFSGFGAPVNWIAADIVRIKMEPSSSVGTLSRMKQPKKSRLASGPCLGLYSD
jgi:predicted SnoaL-like aldol condensation-catalyzing enzyme